jgi:hypothetical protein
MTKPGGKLASTSRAEAMRRHREIFEYGVAHGLSLKDAEAALVRQRHAALMAGIEARRAAPPRNAPIVADNRSDRWMMRD